MTGINYIEGTAPVKELINALAVALTQGESGKWVMVEPNVVTGVQDYAVIKTTNSYGKTFYLKLERPVNSINHLIAKISDTLEFTKSSTDVRCAWYKNNPKLLLEDWLPVKYWINQTKDYANIILQGDESVDIPPKYDNFMTSFLLTGTVQSYEGAVVDDVGNFYITAASDVMPSRTTTYGLYTGDGVLDVTFVGTRAGVPYQRHDCKYDAISPFIRNNRVRESLFTSKFHASEITIHHHTDGERGKLPGLLIGSKGGLNQANELVKDKGLATEETYKFFNITAPYKFYNNGPNSLYGLFLRKS